MTYTEQHLRNIAKHIQTLCKLARAGKASLSIVPAGEAQQISNRRYEAKRQALLAAFRKIGHEVVALPQDFCESHPEVPWHTLSAWADDNRFPDTSFNLVLCQQWLQIATTAEAAILRHTGTDTLIQQAVMAQNDRRVKTLAEQWRTAQATPHIFLWVTVVIIGTWLSTLNLLQTTPTITESCFLVTLALSCVAMIRAARPVKPAFRQLFSVDSYGIHTHTELYDQSLEFHAYNTNWLEREIRRNSVKWKRREQQWATSATIFLVAVICARILPIP